MLAQRTLQASGKRLTAPPAGIALARLASPAAIATNTNFIQKRQATANAEESNNLLAKQRLNRPVSPHLGIYRPQITWYASAGHRITGSLLSGGLYVWGFGYLVSPLFGWHWSSNAIAASFAAWPAAVKVATKATLAFPFVFHSLNGLRHLMWDVAVGVNNKVVIQTGWTVVAASVLGTLYLALAY